MMVTRPVDQAHLVLGAQQPVDLATRHDVSLISKGQTALVVLPAIANGGRARRNHRQHPVPINWQPLLVSCILLDRRQPPVARLCMAVVVASDWALPIEVCRAEAVRG